MPLAPIRHAKGVSFGGLAKLLRQQRVKQPFACSPRAAELLELNMLPTEWYPLSDLHELLAVMDREVLKGNEEAGIKLGTGGAIKALKTYHKGFLKPGDPEATLLAMQHAWSRYFDFGTLTVTKESPKTMQFVVGGYSDVPIYHGVTIIGWHLAAAISAGSSHASAEILERPWVKGFGNLIYRIRI